MRTQEVQKKLERVMTRAYADYKKKLIAHAFFKINNRAICEDLVQDTFMKTWNYLKKGGKIDSMKAFLYHVLNNLIIDQYRKHKTVSLDALVEKGYEPRDDGFKKMFEVLDGASLLPLLEDLPVKYKNILRMRYKQDLSLDEMSDLTKESKNNIAVEIHRGLGKLKMLYTSFPKKFFAS